MLKKFRNVLLFSGFFLALALPAAAQQGESGMDDAINDINSFTTSLASAVTTMVGVAVTPAGISASIKAFKHIVLGNV